MSTKAFGAFMGVLAVLALLGFGMFSGGGGSVGSGEEVPATELPTLEGDGTGSLADHRGKWVLVNIWASWCTPCRDEAPALQDFYERNRKRGVVTLGIDTQDTTRDGAEFVEEFGLTYPHLHDGSGDYADELGATGVPESFLVDPQGKLVLRRAGPVTDEYLREQIEPLIEDGA